MSDRYSKIYSLPNSLYTHGAPIIITAGTILKNNESGTLIGQLKLHSISDKAIKLVSVELTCLDSIGRNLGSPIVFEYLDLSITRGMDFGTQTPIKIPNSKTRSYNVKITEVAFVDNTVWINSEEIWKELPAQVDFSSAGNHPMAIKGYQSFFGADANYLVSVDEDIWRCSCGGVNHYGEERCYKCGTYLNELKDIDNTTLVIEGAYITASKKAQSNNVAEVEEAKKAFSTISEYKDSAQLAEDCSERITKLQAKNRKTIKLASFIAGGVLLFSLLGYFLFYPLISYWCGNYKVYINMYNVEEFTVPDGVTSIDPFAFLGCTDLKSVTIPNSVTSIGTHAFDGCSGLTSITIPDSVTSIDDYAFSCCSGLTSITIPDGVTSIGHYAFNGCSGLTSITIPDGVTSIACGTFYYCSGLTSITIPDGVTSIGSEAFFWCSGLTSITIPDGVTSIGSEAFFWCSGLTSVTIGSGVTSIGEDAFYKCSSLTSITIPDSVTSIGAGAFFGCSGLISIKYRGTETQWYAIRRDYSWDSVTGQYTITYNYTGK